MSEALIKLFYYESGDKYSSEMFESMWNEDYKTLIYTMFYLRKNRPYVSGTKGRGEKSIFNNFIIWMSYNHLDILAHLIPHIPDYGYWKDLLQLMATPAENLVINLFADQLIRDYKSYSAGGGLISLACKWTPNEKSSNDIKHGTFGKIARHMGITNKELRKKYLVPLRKYLPLTEQLITAKNWHLINYHQIPKKCLEKNTKIFRKYDPVNFLAFEKTQGCSTPIPFSLRKSLTGKKSFVDISYEKYLQQEGTVVAIDISHCMTLFQKAIAISLLSEMIGVKTWVFYNFYGTNITPTIHTIDDIIYNHRYLKIFETIATIQHNEDIFSFASNLQSCVDYSLASKKRNLIVLSNTSIDLSEINFKGELELIYWCLTSSHVQIENIDQKILVDGYDTYIYNKICNLDPLDTNIYRSHILGQIMKEYII